MSTAALRVGVAGAAGRMGRTLLRAVEDESQTRLALALEREGADALGTDAGVLAGLAADAEASGWDGFFIWDHVAMFGTGRARWSIPGWRWRPSPPRPLRSPSEPS